jgi:hypothetical protein
MAKMKLALILTAAAFVSGAALANAAPQTAQAPKSAPMMMDKQMHEKMHASMPKMSRNMMRRMRDAKEREATKQLNEQQLHKH